MKKTSFLILLFTIIITSCIQVTKKNNKDILVKQIDNLENKYFSDKQSFPTEKQMDTLIASYGYFIKNYKKDSLAVHYMYKQANLFLATKKYNSAVALFGNICDNYKDFEKRPEALFYQAMIYGDYLKNEVLAQKKYEEFIKDYPNHDLRDDAEKSIQFLGKTSEEIIEILTKKDTLNK